MKFKTLHSWDLTPTQAVALQRELASKVDDRSPLGPCRLIGGADVSYTRFTSTLYAAVVVLRADDLSVVEKQFAVQETRFPYVPGLLSFREAPALLQAFSRLQCEPDVVLFDGQGLAHPRRFGLACHVGLWLDRPTLGCAKSLLCGEVKWLRVKAGSASPLRDKDEVVGMAVRTRHRVKPVYVSAGHRIDLTGAVHVTLQSCGGYRLPEPTRQAHLFGNELRSAALCQAKP
jgi:deoxyribonuclease V